MHSPCHCEPAPGNDEPRISMRQSKASCNNVWTMRRSAHLALVMLCGMVLHTIPTAKAFSTNQFNCVSSRKQPQQAYSSSTRRNAPLASSFTGESSSTSTSNKSSSKQAQSSSASSKSSVDAAVSKAVSSLEHAASATHFHKKSSSSSTNAKKLVHAKRQAQREFTNLESAFFITVQDSSSSSETTTTTTTKASSTQKQTAKELAWSRRVAELTFANNTDPVLLFDGVCNLCNDAVNFCLDHDSHGILRFASLQSVVGQALLIENGRDPNDRSTMVLVTASSDNTRQSSSTTTATTTTTTTTTTSSLEIECLTGSDAVLKLASDCLGDLPLPVRVSAKASQVLVPRWFRDAVLKLVSENRHVLGETDGPTCRLDLDGIYEKRFLEDPDLE